MHSSPLCRKACTAEVVCLPYVITPSPFVPRILLSKMRVFFKAPEHVGSMRGVLLRGASHEPKDVFVSEGVLHVSVMGVALCRAGGNPFCLPLPPLWISRRRRGLCLERWRVNNIVLKLPRRCCTAECECAMVDRTETGAKITFST